MEKDGWTITADPLILRLEGIDLKADLGAEKTFAAEKAGQKIAIELKEFTAISAVSELEKTVGQLQFYQWALDTQVNKIKFTLGLGFDCAQPAKILTLER